MDDLPLVVDHAGGDTDLAAEMCLYSSPVMMDSGGTERPLDNAREMVKKDGHKNMPLNPLGDGVINRPQGRLVFQASKGRFYLDEGGLFF
ncbi:MAG: hypothetical protein ACUVR9_11495 [Desulfosoma sp.]